MKELEKYISLKEKRLNEFTHLESKMNKYKKLYSSFSFVGVVLFIAALAIGYFLFYQEGLDNEFAISLVVGGGILLVSIFFGILFSRKYESYKKVVDYMSNELIFIDSRIKALEDEENGICPYCRSRLDENGHCNNCGYSRN